MVKSKVLTDTYRDIPISIEEYVLAQLAEKGIDGWQALRDRVDQYWEENENKCLTDQEDQV